MRICLLILIELNCLIVFLFILIELNCLIVFIHRLKCILLRSLLCVDSVKEDIYF